MLRKLFIGAVILAVGVLGASAQVSRGEKMLGVKLGYVGDNRSAVTGLTFRYAVTPWVRVAPEIGCVFRNNNRDAFLIDLNAQMPITFDSKKVALYPLVGLAYNSWSIHGKVPVVVEDNNKPSEPDPSDELTIETKDAEVQLKSVSNRYNRFGVNFGAGFDMSVTSTINVGFEAKYTLVKNFSSFYLTASVSYRF